MKRRGVDPELLWLAARRVSAKLTKSGVPHALIGGLAVGVYGYEAATNDVDFLILGEDLAKLTGRPLTKGLTEMDQAVRIDYVNVDDEISADRVEHIVRYETTLHADVPVVSVPALVLLKLVAGRMKDKAAVVELLKRGRVPLKATAAMLSEVSEDLVSEFNLCLLEAKQEG